MINQNEEKRITSIFKSPNNADEEDIWWLIGEIKILKEGCRHRGDTQREVDGNYIIVKCKTCDALLEVYIK